MCRWIGGAVASAYCSMGGCGGSFLWRTTDGGNQWTALARVTGGLSGFETGLTFVTPRVGWVPAAGGAGGLGGMNLTSDGGATWRRVLARYDVLGGRALALVTPSVGWFIGCSRTDTGTVCDTLWHTADGGRTWTKTGA